MTATYSHTPTDVEALEDSTGLQLLCWLDPGDGGPLLPVLAKPGQRLDPEAHRAMALRLSGRVSLIEPSQVGKRAG